MCGCAALLLHDEHVSRIDNMINMLSSLLGAVRRTTPTSCSEFEKIPEKEPEMRNHHGEQAGQNGHDGSQETLLVEVQPWNLARHRTIITNRVSDLTTHLLGVGLGVVHLISG